MAVQEGGGLGCLNVNVVFSFLLHVLHVRIRDDVVQLAHLRGESRGEGERMGSSEWKGGGREVCRRWGDDKIRRERQ